MSETFMQVLAFILVAGLIFFNDSKSKYADVAKLILSIGCSCWLVAQSVVTLADKLVG